jgi:hypothetical protein
MSLSVLRYVERLELIYDLTERVGSIYQHHHQHSFTFYDRAEKVDAKSKY